jgi:hypothetical protein
LGTLRKNKAEVSPLFVNEKRNLVPGNYLFGCQDDKTLVSLVTKKKKVVLVLSTALIQNLHQRCLTLTLVALVDITEHEGKDGRGEETSRNMRGRMEEGKNVVLYSARCGAGCWI